MSGEGTGGASRRPGDPGGHVGTTRWSQSRASPTPILRLGVQCERSVRDPI